MHQCGLRQGRLPRREPLRQPGRFDEDHAVDLTKAMDREKACPRTLLLVLILAILSCVAECASRAEAQDLSASNWTSEFGRNLLTGATHPILDLTHSDSPLSGLSISGQLSNTSGMWANSSALRNFGRQ